MQVNFNLLPQSNYAQNKMQNNQKEPSFGINVSRRFLKAAQQNLTGLCSDLGEDFLGKSAEIKVYGNNTTVYDYTQREGKHILSIVDCKTIGDKFFPQKRVDLEKQESFLDLICSFINRDKHKVKNEELLVSQSNNNIAFSDIYENAPDINF